MYIYKILTGIEFEHFQETGVFKGTPLDLQDGYIHCSTEQQWQKTLQKFFSNEDSVFLLKINASSFSENLRWEESPSSGQIYPHVYAELPWECVIEVKKVKNN